MLIYAIILLNDTEYLYLSKADHTYQLFIAVVMVLVTIVIYNFRGIRIDLYIPYVWLIPLVTVISFMVVFFTKSNAI